MDAIEMVRALRIACSTSSSASETVGVVGAATFAGLMPGSLKPLACHRMVLRLAEVGAVGWASAPPGCSPV